MEKHEPKQIVFAKNKGEYAKPKKELVERSKRRLKLESEMLINNAGRDPLDALLGY